jgi:hypothetical protein
MTAALQGCGAEDPDSPSPADDGVPSIEVGTGLAGFQPIPPGADLEVIYGSQGGYHVWLSVRGVAEGETATVAFGLVDADTGEDLSWSGLKQTLPLATPPDASEASGLICFLKSADASALYGRHVTPWAEIADGTGATARDEADAVLVRDDGVE